jgi:halogenation protein CepH
MTESSLQRPLKVVVVGGGPAGATAAGILASEGVEVTVIERETFPRHHVGESLQPACIQVLDRHLGLGPAIEQAGFARKYGAIYIWGRKREPWSVIFDDKVERDLPNLDEPGLLAGDYEYAWQVDRAKFDSLILDEAVRRGATLLQTTATDVLMDEDRVVGVLTAEGPLHADWVIDASGQRCLVGKSQGLTKPVPDLQATATYAYFKNAGGYPGPLGRHVQWVVTIPSGWVWFIPTSAGTTSVGVVIRERRRLSDEEFRACVAEAHLPLEDAEQIGETRFAKDWSYSLTQHAGPGWVAVGDAAGFVDPILSGGVDAAIRNAASCALALLSSHRLQSDKPLHSFAARQRREHKTYLEMARYWYSNNASMEGLFWKAHESITTEDLKTPLRAFVYLTSGRYQADRHFKVFAEWQEQKIFRALGVEKDQLASSVAARNKR